MEDNLLMEQTEFTVASRYCIRPALSAILDTSSGAEVRVEPRLMKLLCILSAHPRQVVSREHLVREIWDDYGGGEEGLTYAISSLRKLLNDASKTLIETVPKKGYALQSEITRPSKKDETRVVSKKKRWQRSVSYISIFFLTAVLIGLVHFFANQKRNSVVPSKPKDLSIAFSGVSRPPEETRLNTIVTAGTDGTQYKLKVVGDSRPEFYINGQLVSPDEMEKHAALVNNLKRELERRNIQ